MKPSPEKPTPLLFQHASSASLDPPRAWTGGRIETKKWASLNSEDIVICCTADDVCEPAPWLTRVYMPRKVFGTEMVFADGRSKLDLVFARIATKVPETNGVLLSGAIVAAQLRKENPQSTLVALTFGASLSSTEFARTVVVYAFLSDGKIIHDVYDAVRDLDGLKAQVSAAGGRLFKALQEDHTREATLGKRSGPFVGVDISTLVASTEDEVRAAARAVRRHRYVTPSVKAQGATRSRVAFCAIVGLFAGSMYGYGYWIQQQTEALRVEARDLEAKSVALAKATDIYLSQRHRAYAKSVGVNLPDSLTLAQSLAAESPGTKLVLDSRGGKVRYEQHVDRVVVLTPGATSAAAGVISSSRSVNEYVAVAKRETSLDLLPEPLAMSRNSDRVVKGFRDETNSARFADSVIRSLGL